MYGRSFGLVRFGPIRLGLRDADGKSETQSGMTYTMLQELGLELKVKKA